MSTEIKQTSIKEEEQITPIIDQSEEERTIVSNVVLKFRNSADDRNRDFEYFDGDNLVNYINDSVRRFITNEDSREDIEDWQARVHDPFTRNKSLAILAKIVRVLPIAEVSARGDGDSRKANILGSLYDYSEEVDDYEELMTFSLLEAIVKGTVIGYEGLDRSERKVRNVKKGEADDIIVEEGKVINNRLFGSIVPLEDFYPASVSFRNIKAMPYCFWRTVIPFAKFTSDWSMFDKAKYVLPRKTGYTEEARPFYDTMISEDVKEGEVEIIRFYDKINDEYIVLANGIWLNPLVGEIISPIPFNHKELPFWDVKFDFFGSDFFYGKSLPDRLKNLQDVLNVLTNMLLDQSFLTIFPPLLTNGFDSIEDDYLRPGRRTPIDTQGLPLNQSFMKLDPGTPSGWHQYILEYTRKIMEESSVDQVSQGVAGQGDRTTAQEVRIAADAVASTLGLFGRMVNYGVKRKAQLKCANILQFWTDETSPMVEKILGEGGSEEMNKAFNIIKIDNTVLTSGKRGVKVIELYANKEDMPTKGQLKTRAKLAELDSNKKIEIVALPAQYIREFEFDIKLIPNTKTETSKELEKAMQLEKAKVYLTFFPDLVNRKELAAETAEKMGDDPAKILNQDAFEMPPQSDKPQDNTANNMVQGMQGGQKDSMALRDLQGLMLG